MYDDEQRSPSLTASQLRKLETADVDRLYTKYLSLRGKSGSLDSSQVSVLRRQLNQARSEARAMRAENSELRKQLTRVRNSRSMKAGKAIGTPVRILRSARRKVTAAGIGKSQVGSRPVKQVAGAENPGKSNVRQVVDTPVVSTPAVSRVPHSGLADQLRAAWFTQGSITKAYDLVCENEDSFAQGDPVTARLANQVSGEYRFRSVGIEIPVRSAGTAYTPEHDRVLYCVHSTPAYNSNGYSSRTNGVAKGMAAAGRDVIVVSRAGYPWDTRTDVPLPTEIRHVEEVEGIDYVHIPGPNLNTDAFDQYVAEATDAFVREATLSRPSLIHAASNYRTALPALVAARRLGLPFVYEVRGLWEITEASKKPGFENTERFAEMRRWETVVATEADQVLAITEGVAEELERRGVPGDKIHVIPNAVDPAEFVPIPRDVRFATGLGLNPDLPTVGFAGSMVSYEGLDVLIEASTRLNEEGVLHQLALAGSGDDERRLRTLSHGQEHIHFLGRLPQGDVIRLLSFIDVVACPRRKTVITELVSALKPLESFSMSTATVLSDVAPNLTLAGDPDQPRAMVVEADNAQDLARGLRTLISDEDLRRDIGETGRLWVVRERNWSTIGLKIAGAQRDAMATYKARQHAGPKLADLKVGVIADEFTREGLSETFRTVAISRDSWAEQLKDSQLDMMFVESAWEGNGGEWHHGVGYYGAKENADLFALLDACQEANIPTVFWNKEDPVHYARFAPTAARFDHVFTTDAKMISRYWTQRDNRNLTVSSHSFYAQPRIHNPLPSPRAFSPTVAYAGTYYGDRYPDRTVRLEALLEAARVHGLDIYDRQADLPDSPYRFPVDLQGSVRGALPYREVVDSYKAHLAHINVNSVEDSPSMFSRRVVEIPACGGILMSADGRGISETLGSVLATSNDSQMYSAWLHDWSTDPESWLRERWLQLRAVMRSHTSTTALCVLARTAGIPVCVPGLPPYALSVEKLDERLATEITRQSVRPKAVISEYMDDEAGAVLARAGIDAYETLEEAPGIEWSGRYFPSASRTHYEDLLTATNYGSWKYLDARIGQMREHSTPMADPQTGGAGEWGVCCTIR